MNLLSAPNILGHRRKVVHGEDQRAQFRHESGRDQRSRGEMKYAFLARMCLAMSNLTAIVLSISLATFIAWIRSNHVYIQCRDQTNKHDDIHTNTCCTILHVYSKYSSCKGYMQLKIFFWPFSIRCGSRLHRLSNPCFQTDFECSINISRVESRSCDILLSSYAESSTRSRRSFEWC